MPESRWRRTWELFHECLAREAGERRAYLESACDDESLRREVESLLRSHELADAFFERSPDDEANDEIPTAIGPYRILEKLGEGGMGVVFKAEQLEPIRRVVAVKWVKAGLGSAEFVERFKLERQTLARMNHPGIATILDGGSSPEGRPYLVMEFVDGIPLLRYADEKRLSIDERIELFCRVCDAVQHAHQRGVIHRDLKPGNVLVADEGEGARPKVIDFGVAKTLTPTDPGSPSQTRAGVVVGTIEYMSPEQIELERDLDTRTDIYALGVILHRLIVAIHPFGRVAEAGDERALIHAIRRDEPEPISSHLSNPALDWAEISRRRATTEGALRRRLRGELSWIVRTALRRERGSRYASAGEFAADLRRYLRGEAVSVGPPTLRYRTAKWIRRHRWAAAAALAALLGTASGLTGLGVGLVEARRSQHRAETVGSVLKQLISSIDPNVAAGRDTGLVRDMLGAVRERIEAELADDPGAAAELYATMADGYQRVGDFENAEICGRRGVELAARVGTRTELYASATNELTLVLLGAGHLEEALEVATECVAAHRAVFGDDDRRTLSARNNRALALRALGRYEGAEAVHREILSVRRRTLEPTDDSYLASLHNLATVLRDRGRFDEASGLMLELIPLLERKYGKRHTEYLRSIDLLGLLYGERGRLDEAEAYHREAVRGFAELTSPTHTDTLAASYFLGRVLLDQGRIDEATEILRSTRDALRPQFGDSHRGTVFVTIELADALRRRGDLEGSRSIAEENLRAVSETFGVEHEFHARVASRLAHTLVDAGEADAAERLLVPALERLLEVRGPEARDSRLALEAREALRRATGGRPP